jgi:C1A family cysteine protease
LDKGVPQAFSRLFIYYNERAIEGTIDQDAGAEIRDGVKACAKLGVALEADWPYYTVQFKKRPALNVFNDALTRQITSYQRVDQKLTAMQNCLAQGFPFVFGFTVYESFTDQRCDQTGILNMPKPNEKMDGGHAVLCVGYNNRTKRFLVRNSWGANWGQKGYFTMPYDYLLNSDLASDFWTIRLSETSNGTNR